MKRITLPREFAGQVGIAFPVGVRVTIIEARVAVELGPSVSRESAMRQLIAVGVADHLAGGSTVPNEIAFA